MNSPVKSCFRTSSSWTLRGCIKLWKGRKYVYSWSVPFLLLPIIFSFPSSDPADSFEIETGHLISKSKAAGCAYVLLLMSLYWLLEAVPMAITALLPVVFFPLLGIMETGLVSKEYMKDTVMIFLASLVAAAAVEESNLHQRIALRVLRLFGTKPYWLLLGFMTNTMFLSMWISNTASTALMIPIVDAVLMQICPEQMEDIIEEEENEYRPATPIHRDGQPNSVDTNANIELGRLATDNDTEDKISTTRRKSSARPLSATRYGRRRTSLVSPEVQDIHFSPQFNTMRKAIYLGVCYAANIGGTGTLTGTGTNLILYGFVTKDSTLPTISFGSWMYFAVPGMLINVVIAWIFISVVFLRKTAKVSPGNGSQSGENSRVDDVIRERSESLGGMSFHEHCVLWLFILLIALWFTRSPEWMPGWAKLFTPEGKNTESFIRDSCPAVLVVVLYFMIPKDPSDLTSKPLMTWKTTQDKVAWNVVLLLGGGFALSSGAQESGLSRVLGHFLKGWVSGISILGVQLVTCCFALVLTEVASNATTATILLGVVENVARSMGINPLSIMVPLTLCCSYAFMLPVGSPTNAIIFEAGGMKIREMAIPGIVMKILCLGVTLLFSTVWGPLSLWKEWNLNHNGTIIS